MKQKLEELQKVYALVQELKNLEIKKTDSIII